MKIESQSMMKNVISEVLETMFFIMINFDGLNSSHRAYDFESRIDLCNESEKLQIGLCVREHFAKMVAANFVGKRDEEVENEEMEDVMKELANMVGGNYMSKIASKNWQLGIPSFGRFEGGDDSQSTTSVSLFYMGENVGMLIVRPYVVT